MMVARRLDPRTCTPIERLPNRGNKVRREPSSERVDHLLWDWFPLRVSPGKERLARLLLEDRGIVTFCPTETKWRNANRYTRAKNAKRQVTYPWHPGLVCVGLQAPYPWHRIMPLPMVQSVISDNPAQPRRMRHDAIWRLMQRFGEGRFVPPDEQRHMLSGKEFAPGDVVRVTEGVMEGKTFRVQMISGSMATLFGRWFGTDLGFDAPVRILAKED